MTVTGVFSAIVAAIQSLPLLESWFEQLIAAWMAKQTAQTLSAISDAADEAASAKNSTDRFAADQKWLTALSAKRELP